MISQSHLNTRRAETISEIGPARERRSRAGGPPAFPDPSVVEAALHLLAEHLEQGLAVTDRSGRAHFLNRAAQAFVARGLLCLEHGGLRGAAPEDSAALRRVIARCAAGHRGGSVRLEGAGGTLLVAASAVPGTLGPIGEGAVLLRLTDPGDPRLPDPGILQDQFGFTPAEAALAVDILAGNDLAASATRRRITRNTARVHLRHLFEKTGTRRQAELVRLLLLCPQPIADAEHDPAKIFAPQATINPNGGCAYSTIKRR